MSRAAVLNAFSPAQEVVEPSGFAGRREEVKALADALQTAGATPVIYGDRGLGKTSLGVQAQLIAMGDTQLLVELGHEDWALAAESTFITLYVTCTYDVKNADDLQTLIVHGLEDVTIEPITDAHTEAMISRTTRRKLSFKMFEAETSKTYGERASRLRTEELSSSERLRRELTLLYETASQAVLIVIDELDRVRDLSGFASVLRATAGDVAKYLLVGVAENLSDLNLDHPSMPRNLHPVHVRRMSAGELADIVDLAQKKLQRIGLNYKFSGEARTRLVRLSGGFPWFVHVIGQQALIRADESGSRQVMEDHVIEATQTLVKNRFAQQFKDTYQRAVRDSYNREIVLRIMAAWKSSDIPTSEVYTACQRIGLTSAAVYKGHLSSDDYGRVLIAPPHRDRGLIRFADELFKQYVWLVPSYFAGVENKVREATKAW